MPNPLEQLISSLSAEKRAVLAELLRPAPEPIAIIGIGCRFPGGATSPDTFWDVLRTGTDTISEIPADRWQSDAFYDPNPDAPGRMYTRWGGFVRDAGLFDAGFFGISPKEAQRMDPQQRMLLEVAWEAFEHAGIAISTLAGSQTGVFIGIVPDDYTLLQVDRSSSSYADDPYFTSGSSSSMASGRLSYQFDLQGPNMAIDTACSSSLVATHLACQSLRNKECDLALVGGVNAIVLPEVMVKLCKMRMLASDGRCKTFDAAADGFALGEGCGVVILKRLGDAIRDGDQVIALIRGSAVNEDGRSTSQTAPNGLAQQAVIRQALASARIAPQQVGYVEAHGSGTALGDPIEVEAIGSALCKERSAQQPLAIGTVKTNIGHLVGAAGVAGLIKTALALRHGEIPAHLNLNDRSPGIDWDAYPLVVPAQTLPWRAEGGSRIAGVSSFGWAGTNAHVVLEEAAVPVETHSSKPWHLLVLSAKTATALDSATANLAAHLAAHAEIDLADAAYTLQVGRCDFAYRRMLVCRDREQALATLPQSTSERLLSSHAPGQRGVTFIFAGVGEHYTGMARELYQAEPTFRETVDQCCTILQPLLGRDLRDALFTDDQTTDNRQPTTDNRQPTTDNRQPTTDNRQPTLNLRALLGRNGAEAADPLHQTALAQPAMFVIEYALAQLLKHWGVQPQAMLGYSLGEYVAACLAGVLALDQALKLVATRAQLIQSLPPGAMLAVALAEQALQPFLSEAINLAVINSPSTCVVAGPVAAIAALEQTLREQEVACRRLDTSHAFHSAMLAPIANAVTALARTLTLKPPTIPYISNVTGTWITDAQATDPVYWARHMLAPVRFADGVAALLATPERVLLEIGPGQALGSFIKQHPACMRERFGQVLATLPAAHERISDHVALLTTLGKLWLLGADVDWAGLHQGERRRVPLPTYPFERQHFWVEPAVSIAHNGAPAAAPSHDDLMSVPKQHPDDWFYVPGWRQSAALLPSAGGLSRQAGLCWLMLEDTCGIGAELTHQLAAQGQMIATVRPGHGFAKLAEHSYTVDPRARADYERVLRDLRDQGQTPSRVVHAWTLSAAEPDAPDELEAALDLSFYSLLFLCQALGDLELEQCRITVLSSGVQQVTGYDQVCPEKATIIGPTRIVPFEYPALRCRNIDIVVPEAGSQAAATLLRHILGELTQEPAETVVALRDNRRWVQTLEPMQLTADTSQPSLLRQRGVYMITGGLGGIGLAIAEDLARVAQARLVLLGRSALPDRHAWPAMIAGNGAAGDLGRRVRQVQSLEALGAEVLVVQADVADAGQMQAAVQQALERFGTIHGVVHAAGVPGMGLISVKTPEQAARVFAPKIQGTHALSHALRGIPLDFLALCSSIASVTGGGAGQVDYCAANAFLDAYALRHSHEHGLTIAIGWGEWQWNAWEYAMNGYSAETQNFFRTMRQRFGMQFAEGTEAFRRALARQLPNVFVATQDLREIHTLIERSSIASLMRAPRPKALAYPRPMLGASYIAPRNDLEATIADVWSEQLGIVEVGINDNFFELGGNSLVGFELLAKLRKRLHIDQIPAYVLYQAPSVSAMATFFAQDQSASADVDERHDRGAKRRERQAHKKRG